MVKGVCDVPMNFFSSEKPFGKFSWLETDWSQFSLFFYFQSYREESVSLFDLGVFFPKRNLFSFSRIQKSASVITSLKEGKVTYYITYFRGIKKRLERDA